MASFITFFASAYDDATIYESLVILWSACSLIWLKLDNPWQVKVGGLIALFLAYPIAKRSVRWGLERRRRQDQNSGDTPDPERDAEAPAAGRPSLPDQGEADAPAAGRSVSPRDFERGRDVPAAGRSVSEPVVPWGGDAALPAPDYGRQTSDS